MNGKFRLIFVLLIALLLFSGCAREVGLGVLDMERVIEEAPRARHYQEQLDEAGQEIEERYDEGMSEMSTEERMVRQEEAYQEYTEVRNELEDRLNREIERAVSDVAEEKGLDIVFYNKAVSFGGQDITDLVIEKLE